MSDDCGSFKQRCCDKGWKCKPGFGLTCMDGVCLDHAQASPSPACPAWCHDEALVAEHVAGLVRDTNQNCKDATAQISRECTNCGNTYPAELKLAAANFLLPQARQDSCEMPAFCWNNDLVAEHIAWVVRNENKDCEHATNQVSEECTCR